MKKVITYGTYDLLHYGHIALLKRAKSLGDYLIVGVTSDAFDKQRGKLNVQQTLVERIEAVRSLGIADEIIVEEYTGQKIADIQKHKVDIFTVGSDWIGQFDYLNEYCEVIYLPRTEGISSTQVRTETALNINLGIIGVNYISYRLADESLFLSGLDIVTAFDENEDECEKFCHKYHIKSSFSLESFFKKVNAVYINKRINYHYKLIKTALEENCHVICAAPIFMNVHDAEELYALAKSKNLVLMEDLKTEYFPAFEHLNLMVHSGVIGDVKSIDVNCSQIPANMHELELDKYAGSFYDWSATALLPIMKLLGVNYKNSFISSIEQNDYSFMTSGSLIYENAIANFKIGRGLKFEGNLVIAGTNGYIFVPSPWWLTEYFEIRYEDLREAKRIFYKYAGNGLRYMLFEFLNRVTKGVFENLDNENQKKMQAALIEKFSEVQKVEM